jgi:pilus assembly protein FimV
MQGSVVTKKDKHLAAAQKFLERGQYEKALAEFAGVVQEDPGDTRTWLKMAEIYAGRGATDQARDIYLRTGDLYHQQGFFQKAVAVYKNVLKLSPGLAEGHLRLGETYRQLGWVADALQQLELGAAALQRAGRAAEAMPALRQMVELHPENVVSRIKLAESASQAGALDEAVREFTEAAAQLKAQGRGDEYVRVAERLLFHQPHNFPVARELAASYVARGNPRLALAKLQAPLKAAPRDPANVELLARAFEPLDAPKALSVWRELAQIYDGVGRATERDAAVRSALALDFGDAETLALARRWGTALGAAGSATPPPRPSPSRTGTSSSGKSGVGSRLPPPLPPPGSGPPRQSSPATAAPPTPPPVPRPAAPRVSAQTPGPQPDVARILSEAEVFVKYGLLERAVDHVRRVFELERDHRGARNRLASMLAQLGRRAEAASELATLAEALRAGDPAEAAAVAARALELDPACARAAVILGRAPAATHGSAGGGGVAPTPPPLVAADSTADLMAELEQVDFFLEQALVAEARSTLDELTRRYGEHPLLAAKAREIERAEPGAVPQEAVAGAGRDEPAPVARMTGGEKADLSTHGDLGIAYKEMGLFDAAIAEFKLLTADPAREVFALTMIGECLEAKGTLTDAVVRYKEALNCAGVTAPEALLLYHLLGSVFERLGDPAEALYFYEKVAKRDPHFQGVDRKIAALKPRNAHHG